MQRFHLLVRGLFLCIVISVPLFGCKSIPSKRVFNKKVLLFFDLNKTLLMADVASGKKIIDVANGMLAENVPEFYRDFSGDGKIISYHKFVKSQFSNPKDSSQKKKIEEILFRFLGDMSSLSKFYSETDVANARNLYSKILTNLKTYKGLVKGFFNVLEHDWFGREVLIVIRTFGCDIPAISRQLIPMGYRITKGRIDPVNKLAIIEGRGAILLKDIFNLYDGDSKHLVFLQDNYKYWAEGNKDASHGKPFPVFEGEVVSMFFDDNIEKAKNAKEDDIVYPFDPETNRFISPFDARFAFSVDPLIATQDEKFFIRTILKNLH